MERVWLWLVVGGVSGLGGMWVRRRGGKTIGGLLGLW
jgi:hypothetical protein